MGKNMTAGQGPERGDSQFGNTGMRKVTIVPEAEARPFKRCAGCGGFVVPDTPELCYECARARQFSNAGPNDWAGNKADQGPCMNYESNDGKEGQSRKGDKE
jgi:hypothetical protein